MIIGSQKNKIKRSSSKAVGGEGKWLRCGPALPQSSSEQYSVDLERDTCVCFNFCSLWCFSILRSRDIAHSLNPLSEFGIWRVLNSKKPSMKWSDSCWRSYHIKIHLLCLPVLTHPNGVSAAWFFSVCPNLCGSSRWFLTQHSDAVVRKQVAVIEMMVLRTPLTTCI